MGEKIEDFIKISTSFSNEREMLDSMEKQFNDGGMYAVFGAGNYGKQAVGLIGRDKIKCFIDNDKEKQGKQIDGIEIISLDGFIEFNNGIQIIIAVSEQFVGKIRTQIEENGITNYRIFSELKYEITRNKMQNRCNYIRIYDKAIDWIHKNTITGEGIICNSNLKKSYPEVTGYYIPTLLKWGYKDLALQYAKWLCNIQKKDGSWYDTDNKAPYIFDSAQILKGLLAIRECLPEVDEHIIKGCEWILNNITSEGRLLSPLEDAWGDGKTFSELIHTYCISPIKEAGILFNRSDFVKKADLIADYYTTNCKTEILNMNLLSHFYAYVMEAMIDIGHEELAREAMDKIAIMQKESGAVPGYNNVNWVCSTGLFQLALVWFRLGDIDKGNRAFEYACRLQNESGGWFGSYVSEENPNEENTYFPSSEISWAVKYFLDALYYKNKAEFERQAPRFIDYISKDDGRYRLIENTVANIVERKAGKQDKIKILDVGAGKGRYLKNIRSTYPDVKLYASDISQNVLEYIELANVEYSVGTMTNIKYNNDTFDMVYTCEALEHAIDIEMAIREMTRVTRSDGYIVVIDKNKDKLGCLEIDAWEQWFDKDYLRKLMLKYCSKVDVIDEISYEGKPADGLFCGWIGKVK